jgi:hypothetical protein
MVEVSVLDDALCQDLHIRATWNRANPFPAYEYKPFNDEDDVLKLCCVTFGGLLRWVCCSYNTVRQVQDRTNRQSEQSEQFHSTMLFS